MLDGLNSCTICPHMCKINRNINKKGRCKCDTTLKIGLSYLHYFEEPCISGKRWLWYRFLF